MTPRIGITILIAVALLAIALDYFAWGNSGAWILGAMVLVIVAVWHGYQAWTRRSMRR